MHAGIEEVDALFSFKCANIDVCDSVFREGLALSTRIFPLRDAELTVENRKRGTCFDPLSLRGSARVRRIGGVVISMTRGILKGDTRACR